MTVKSISETTQFLTFTLVEEVFAVEISQVREVLEFTKVTRIPNVPEYIVGVINLRGHVVSVVDLRMKFGLPATDKTVSTCVIIIETELDGEKVELGVMADSVKEVMNLSPDQIEPPPKIGSSKKSEFIRGMGKQDDNFIILLDTNRVFQADELSDIQQINQPSNIKAAAA